MICLAELSVLFEYKIETVLKFEMMVAPNSHATAYLKGVLLNQNDPKLYNRIGDLTPITITGEHILFEGLALYTNVICESGIYNIEIKCISSTIKMDLVRHYKSIQDINMTYEQIINQRTSQYSEAGFVNCCSELGSSIGVPIIQYDETDWEFINRMASCGSAVVYPYVYRTGVHFQISFESGGSNIRYFDETICNIVSSPEGLCFEVRSENLYHVGDCAQIYGRLLFITKVKVLTEDENLIFEYKLCKIPGMERIWNKRIIGASIKGKVIGRNNNKIQLHLEIDAEQENSTAFYFTYKPLTVSGLYALPELETQVTLYFPSKEDDTGYATETINDKEKSKCIVDNKEFKTIDEEYLLMHLKMISFTNGEGTFCANLIPGSVSIQTDNNIKIRSKKNVNFSAKEEIAIKAGADIHICKGAGKVSSIRLNDEVHIFTTKLLVETEASVLTPIPPEEEQTKGVDFNQVEAAKATAGSVPQICNINGITSVSVSAQALAVGSLTAATAPSTVSAKTFAPLNKPKVQLKPIVRVLPSDELD